MSGSSSIAARVATDDDLECVVQSPASVRGLPGTSRSSVSYCIRAPLSTWLAHRAAELASAREAVSVLDVGCGDRRYERLFTSVGATYAGFDGPWNPLADVAGFAEDIPFESGSFDVVLCTQTLEHLPDPGAAVCELRRIVSSGGCVLASTHGSAVYHPSPSDYWRWTKPGLEKLFRDNADWSLVDVAPAQGTAATTAMLVGHLIDLAAKRLRARPLATPFVFYLNLAAETIERLLPILRQPIPGSLTATFHIEARP